MTAAKKPKKLGRIQHCTASVSRFNSPTCEVEVTIENGSKSIIIETTPWCGVKTFMGLAHAITAKQRDYAMSEWSAYKSLRDMSGYKAPEGDDQ